MPVIAHVCFSVQKISIPPPKMVCCWAVLAIWEDDSGAASRALPVEYGYHWCTRCNGMWSYSHFQSAYFLILCLSDFGLLFRCSSPFGSSDLILVVLYSLTSCSILWFGYKANVYNMSYCKFAICNYITCQFGKLHSSIWNSCVWTISLMSKFNWEASTRYRVCLECSLYGISNFINWCQGVFKVQPFKLSSLRTQGRFLELEIYMFQKKH